MVNANEVYSQTQIQSSTENEDTLNRNEDALPGNENALPRNEVALPDIFCKTLQKKLCLKKLYM